MMGGGRERMSGKLGDKEENRAGGVDVMPWDG